MRFARFACWPVMGMFLAATSAPRLASADEPLPYERSASQDIGTPDPISLVAASPDGDWVVVCQARIGNDRGVREVYSGRHGGISGDPLQVYLIEGAGPGRQIDEYLGHDPEGRWLLLRQGRRFLLRDMQTAKSQVLRPSPSYAQSLSRIGPLPAAFVSGQRLVYVTTRGGSEAVVVRELATRKERVLPVGAGKLWSLAPLDDQWLSLRLIVEDTDHNGRLDPPQAKGSYAGTACSSPVSYMSMLMGGDRSEGRIVPLAGGAPRPFAGVLRGLGKHLLVRDPDGALSLQDGAGARTALVPASCHGEPLQASQARMELLVACRSKLGDDEGALVLFSAAHPPRHFEHRVPLERAQLVLTDSRFYDLRGKAQLDLQTGKVHTTPRADWAADLGPRVVLIEDGKLLLRNVDDGSEQVLLAPRYGFGRVLSSGDIRVIEGVVVDMAKGTKLGLGPYHPLAVTRQGRVLDHEPGREEETVGHFEYRFGRGPLHWYLPSP